MFPGTGFQDSAAKDAAEEANETAKRIVKNRRRDAPLTKGVVNMGRSLIGWILGATLELGGVDPTKIPPHVRRVFGQNVEIRPFFANSATQFGA